MDCVFGITGNDYVILAADKSVAQSIIKMQDDDNKIVKVAESTLISSVGEVSTRKDFTKLVKSNLQYNYYKYSNNLLTSEVASFTRHMVADSLRSKNPYQVGSIIAGVDNGVPSLYLIESLGGMERVSKAVLGYASHFLYGLMDSCHKKDFSLEDGKDCIKKCIQELKVRFLMNIQDFDVFVISKDGIVDISNEFNEKK